MSGIELVTTLILQAVPKLETLRTVAFTMGSPLLLAQILDTVPKIFVDITILLPEYGGARSTAGHRACGNAKS